MAGGTLIVSRAVKLYSFIEERFREMGFENIMVIGVEKDGLNMLINELKPWIVFIGCKFYQCCTPFMMAGLHKSFPKLNFAAVSVTDFPDDLAMYFIVNGARSYVNFWEGEEEFFKGMKEIREGRGYVSPEVQRRIDMRSVSPDPSGKLSDRQIEIVRLVANGYSGAEIADTLHISKGTVDNSKSEIYTAMNVRNENEAVRVALHQGIVKVEELHFFPRGFELRPKPNKEKDKKDKRGTL